MKKMRFFGVVACMWIMSQVLLHSALALNNTSDISITEVSQGFHSIDETSKSVKDMKQYISDYIVWLAAQDRFWKGNNPKISWKPVPYFLDDTSTPVAYEWKVRCDKNQDCWSIIVANIDNEFRILEAGTYGQANYEILSKGKEQKKNKLYYYSAFEQYIESTDKDNQVVVDAINPEEKKEKTSSQMYTELKERKNSVKDKKIRFIREDELWVDTKVKNITIDPTGFVEVSPMASTTTCQSAVPCYEQFTKQYWSSTCPSGCSPTAMAIIFGYYDRKGTFPNLVGNSSILAPAWWSTDVVLQTMVNSISWYMWTYCSSRGWVTPYATIWSGMRYARDRGYTNSQNGVYTPWSAGFLFPKIKTQINWAKPLIVNYSSATNAHSMVAYGYNDTWVISTGQVHVNFGWGAYYSDKYISIYSPMVANPSDPSDGSNVIVWQKLTSIVTVPIQ